MEEKCSKGTTSPAARKIIDIYSNIYNLNEDGSPLKSEPETIEYSCKTPSRIDKSNAVYIDGG